MGKFSSFVASSVKRNIIKLNLKCLTNDFCTGMSVRSTYWMGEKILVGTNAGEVFEVLATDKDKPKTIVQVHVHYVKWNRRARIRAAFSSCL